ncbi:DUF3108 domain-containing protein [Isoalcanivorax indicus]|uniref:DUF3108 domain-containing protein n=1 Tax=Isoalcanivorax indicus TaxID=2202653 RepID=UPI000DBA717A|nr:DUF3108 domain-containing protein [Isoalcanivorax indicus]
MGKHFLNRVTSGITLISLTGLLALSANADTDKAPPVIQPFSMTYGLSGSGVPFSIAAERTLERRNDGSWKMEIRARNWLGSIRETTFFTWQDCVPQSTAYEYRRRGLGRTREARLELDRDAGTALARRDGADDRTYEIGDHTTDILSQTLGLQCALMRGQRDNISLDVASERRREDMVYQVIGEESVRVPAGRFNTLKVERVRDDDSDRQTLLWFAPELGYALIRMVQDEGDGQYELVLRNP